MEDFAGTGFQLHRSTAPGHGASRAFAILCPKSKLLPSGTAEDSQHLLTSHCHGCRGKWEIQTWEGKEKRQKVDRKDLAEMIVVISFRRRAGYWWDRVGTLGQSQFPGFRVSV